MTAAEESWTIGRLLSWTIDYLGRHGAENPRLDAEVLLAYARDCRRIDLFYSSRNRDFDHVGVRQHRRCLHRRRREHQLRRLLVRRGFNC